MKFLCTADWQAGVTTLTLDQQEPVWHRIFDLAIDHQVAGVLHAGDLIDGPTLSTEVLAAIRRVFARLRAANIPLLLIRGNGRHDLATRDVDGIDLFHDYEGITVSQRPEMVEIGGAVVVTLPWVSPKHLVVSSNGASRENVYEAASEMLVGIARDLREQISHDYMRRALPKILLLHWSVSGASLPTGLPVDQLHEPILPWTDLSALGFDAVVCGHIHKPQTFPDARGFYCGSPQPLNHGEAGDHGVWIFSPGESPMFVPIDSPQFVTIKSWPDKGWKAWSCDEDGFALPIQDAIVRFQYETTREGDAKIDKDAIRRALLEEGASRVTIEPNIIREARARAEHLTESLSELDALMAYCQAQKIPEELFERMHARTEDWING